MGNLHHQQAHSKLGIILTMQLSAELEGNTETASSTSVYFPQSLAGAYIIPGRDPLRLLSFRSQDLV